MFEETENPKKCLIFSHKKAFILFHETETPPKKFNIFQETDIFYFSGNGKSEKRLIIQEVTF